MLEYRFSMVEDEDDDFDDSEIEGQIFWHDEKDAPKSEEIMLRSIRLINGRGVPQATFEADKPVTIEIQYDVLRRLRGQGAGRGAEPGVRRSGKENRVQVEEIVQKQAARFPHL